MMLKTKDAKKASLNMYTSQNNFWFLCIYFMYRCLSSLEIFKYLEKYEWYKKIILNKNCLIGKNILNNIKFFYIWIFMHKYII